MKRYRIYRSIREQAQIFGLSVSRFAIQMIAVIGGLLLIIFSFSLSLILFVFIGNAGLYIILLRVQGFPNRFVSGGLSLVSNKLIGLSSHEN